MRYFSPLLLPLKKYDMYDYPYILVVQSNSFQWVLIIGTVL